MSQGKYRNDEEALTYLARQLADAFEEARTDEDREYAADAIDDFLSEHDHYAPAKALIALLDLPFTRLTWPLVDSIEETLIERGSVVVEDLLSAAAGHVYDVSGPVPERARQTLEGMSPQELMKGLIPMLRGRVDEDLKQAAVDRLVGLGEAAVPVLEASLQDPAARRWAEDALGDIRAARVETVEIGEALEAAAREDGAPAAAGEVN